MGTAPFCSIVFFKPHRKRTSIRTRLVLLALSGALPAALLAVILITYNYQLEREQEIGDAIRTARAATLAVDRDLAEIEKVLIAMATSPQLAAGDFAGFHRHATVVVRELGLSNISLCDARGECILNTRRPFGEVLPRHGNLQVVERVFQSRRPIVSDVFAGAIVRGPVLNVSVPVMKDGKVLYALGSTVLPNRLAAVLQRQQLPPQWLAAVLDSAGTITARTLDAERYIGQRARPAMMKIIREGPEGAVESRSMEGVPVVIAYSRSEVSNWTVAIGIPRDLITADLYRSLFWLLVATAILLAGGLGFAFYIGGGITAALRKLSDKARELPVRPLAPLAPLYFREADQLGAALVDASVMLHGANRVLAQAEVDLQRGSDELAHSQARLQDIVESAMDAILSFDESLRIVLFNAAAEAIMRCGRQNALGRSVLDFVPARLRKGYEHKFLQFAAQARTSRLLGEGGRITALRADGEEFPAEGSISTIAALDGPRLFTLILRDVTRSARMTAALEQSNLDLQQFAFVASHDLKTPLRSMSGFAQILERDYAPALDDRARNLIRRVITSAERMETLIEDLLSYARLDAKAKPLEPVQCNAVVAEMAELLEPSLHVTGTSLVVDALPTVQADASQLLQLFLNLVQNAIKYRSARPPVIRISARKGQQQEWVISVADNGIGIDDKYHARIFEIFRRLHSEQTYPGTGIGLSLCRRIVERHGGTIWVESSSPEGTVFSFTLCSHVDEDHD